MADVLRALLCAAGAVYLAIRMAGFVRSLVEAVASWRLDRRLTRRRRSDVACRRERATVSSRSLSD